MGSRAGIPNRNKKFLLNRLQDMYGEEFHPIMQMAKNADILQKIADEHAEGEITVGEQGLIDATNSAMAATAAWEKIAPYVEPKLKALEVTGADGEPVQIEEVRRTVVRP